MIAKCKSNLQLASLCNLGNSFQIHPIRKKRIAGAGRWCGGLVCEQNASDRGSYLACSSSCLLPPSRLPNWIIP